MYYLPDETTRIGKQRAHQRRGSSLARSQSTLLRQGTTTRTIMNEKRGVELWSHTHTQSLFVAKARGITERGLLSGIP